MRYLFFALFLAGCSISNTTNQVKNFAKCYIHKIPAPFWVCYQSTFSSVGKVYTEKFTRLKQEEAYNIGLSDLINKIIIKTKQFLRRVEVDNPKILEEVKKFVIINAVEGGSWYKNNMLYVQVKIDKSEFKKFLLKLVNKKGAQEAFDEVF